VRVLPGRARAWREESGSRSGRLEGTSRRLAMEPITLFARIADPAAVARLLRKRVPAVAIDGPDDDWRNAVVTFGEGEAKRTLTFTHDPAYYAEPGWSRQMNGMRGY